MNLSPLFCRTPYAPITQSVTMPKGKKKGTIASIMHPDYRVLITDYNKWRLTYQAGRRFVNAYLKRHSKRESPAEFVERRFMTPCPSFAKAAIDEVQNTIFQRLGEIKRIGGDTTYKEACEGLQGGVDLHGLSMTNFMGQAALMELLPMKKVGIYVDMPAISGETILAAYNKRPYLYLYPAEDIRTWSYQYRDGQYQFNNVLLRDGIQYVDPETGMPMGTSHRWRRVWLDEDGVHIKFYNIDGDADNTPDGEYHFPNMKRIPFVCLEIKDSLLVDIADYQIALMNLMSSDISFLTRANFPFYTEQYDPKAEDIWRQMKNVNGESRPDTNDGASVKEIDTGIAGGRRYPAGMNKPEFIFPSSEPLKASMDKQAQMKAEIRQLIGLALANLTPMHASADSKQMDMGTLESGLSIIGATLEYGEREISRIWAMYLGLDETNNDNCAVVNYPKKYSMKTQSEIDSELKNLKDVQQVAPSILYKKEIAKKIAHCVLQRSIPDEVMDKIKAEIDDAPYIDGTAMDVQQDVINGIVDLETAATARGYSEAKKVVAKAKVEHAERLDRIAQHQSKPNLSQQGNPDSQPTPGANKDANGNPMNPGAGRPTSTEGDANAS